MRKMWKSLAPVDVGELFRSSVAGYAFSIVLVFGVMLVCDRLQQWTGVSSPFLISFTAVILSGLYGGFGPGVITSVSLGILVNYYFLGNGQNFSGAPDIFRSALFIANGILLSAVARSLRLTKERYRAFVANSSEAIWRLELTRPVPISLPVERQIELYYERAYLAEANDAMARLHGFQSAAAITGAPLAEFLSRGNQRNQEFIREFVTSGYRLINAESYEVNEKNEERYIINNFTGIIENGAIARAWGMQRDITEEKLNGIKRKSAEETIRYQAFHDDLTGLPNRNLFSDRLLEAVTQAFQNGQRMAVMFLDLDRFKNINDTLGHTVGDIVLQEVAQRLQRSVREGDMVSRLGGDEFVILLSNINSTHDVVKIARKLLKLFGASFTANSQQLHLSTSIGIALYPDDGTDVMSLLKNADTALYRAKEAGRNNYQLYNKTMGIEASEKLRLENELRVAIANNELGVHYQPVVNMQTNKIISMEALMRWNHPELGTVYPNEFIPLAEDTGLIVQMTSSLFRMVSSNLRNWQQMNMGNFKIDINLSSRQFMQPNAVERLTALLLEDGLSPSAIELEITESIAMKNFEVTIEKMQALKAAGFSISIDDFGTGYSSLSYLKRFPADTLKIDKSFIKNCITDKQDGAIIRAIITMAHSLGLKIIAEGVETKEQWEFLKSLGCDSAQGYYISYPLPPNEIVRMLRKNEHGIFKTA